MAYLSSQLQRSWQASCHLFFGLPVAMAAFLGCFAVPAGVFFTLLLVGAPAWPEIVRILRRFAGYERGRAGGWLGKPIPELYLPLDGSPSDRVRLALTDPGTWRDALWLPYATLSILGFSAVVLVLWPVALLVDGTAAAFGHRPRALPVFEQLADAQARWTAALLKPSPSAKLGQRVAELSESRAGAMESHSAELRRIERDLHDGVQAQLVALSMRVGLARQQVKSDPDTATRWLDEAQEEIDATLAALRGIVRTVHPPVLTDRGLAGAVRTLAVSADIPVEMNLAAVEIGHRLPAAVEAAVYFVIAECLTNIRKHSGATHASVRFTRADGSLQVVVTDNGRGGAEEHGGSGLLGIRRRVAALDGTTEITSPPGGPTRMKVELPCGS
ncbi:MULTISPECIES: sensor histidine kinase [unclassified Streptomyces]|uniref:sensor histidine kinase n=1 Tax=unclassified Streptomyces TaxID=2593676 RepID=UPI00037B9F51|nr:MULTISPECIES: sensor histidine kinase [unclassified Streptomyces]MYQ81796.1 sensor histidine kinase [Streptomyces sp. SID4923]